MNNSPVPQNNQKRVLIVDDNPLVRKMTGKMLDRFGLDVFLARNGQEAVDICSKMFFDLILMDVQMPVMDGIEAIRHIREKENGRTRKTDIIVVTADDYNVVKQKCTALNIQDLIIKPLDVNRILNYIQSN